MLLLVLVTMCLLVGRSDVETKRFLPTNFGTNTLRSLLSHESPSGVSRRETGMVERIAALSDTRSVHHPKHTHGMARRFAWVTIEDVVSEDGFSNAETGNFKEAYARGGVHDRNALFCTLSLQMKAERLKAQTHGFCGSLNTPRWIALTAAVSSYYRI